ncbi:hypothetical protein CIPAW_11G196300 [Carya illinoinensis]|uniref:Uncharacterized protein n=1 Tax=Carya illinoinensis TaxID=32201 RepID=A0A8T1P9P5_CARIL|nr:hypothetical protein CIPAW_11G196300 [Carya illinoinensis]
MNVPAPRNLNRRMTYSLKFQSTNLPTDLAFMPQKRKRYTYCFLHGRNHNIAPPLKCFVSMRRRLLKTQKSMKRENQLHKGKCYGKMKKEIPSSKMLHNGDPVVGNASNIVLSPVKQKARRELLANSHAEEPKGIANRVGISGRENEDLGDFKGQFSKWRDTR